ncbi:hypothetical protein BaRGS_00022234 [Batillaria attramentaria]|uniref:Uncharacterized protein n=1 Tax=Batillaria attramentaria TaxID=370345 RepID=A0ABD0KH96_9CAEN
MHRRGGRGVVPPGGRAVVEDMGRGDRAFAEDRSRNVPESRPASDLVSRHVTHHDFKRSPEAMAHQLDYVNPFTSGTGVIGTSAVPLASPQGDRGHAPPDPTLQTLGQGRRGARLG